MYLMLTRVITHQKNDLKNLHFLLVEFVNWGTGSRDQRRSNETVSHLVISSLPLQNEYNSHAFVYQFFSVIARLQY